MTTLNDILKPRTQKYLSPIKSKLNFLHTETHSHTLTYTHLPHFPSVVSSSCMYLYLCYIKSKTIDFADDKWHTHTIHVYVSCVWLRWLCDTHTVHTIRWNMVQDITASYLYLLWIVVATLLHLFFLVSTTAARDRASSMRCILNKPRVTKGNTGDGIQTLSLCATRIKECVTGFTLWPPHIFAVLLIASESLRTSTRLHSNTNS